MGSGEPQVLSDFEWHIATPAIRRLWANTGKWCLLARGLAPPRQLSPWRTVKTSRGLIEDICQNRLRDPIIVRE